MQLQRFEDLAEAWGGDLNAWPSREQVAARALLAERPHETGAALAVAGALDRLLEASPTVAPSRVLHERVIAGAPRPRRGWGVMSGWVSGAGLAAACAAGVACGIVVAGPTPQDRGVQTFMRAASELGGSLSPIESGRDA